MNKKILKQNGKPEELICAKQLVNNGKFDEALQVLSNFEETGKHNLHEIVSCHLIKCELLYQQGLIEDLVNFAELTYKESLRLGKSLLSVDALYFKAWGLIWLYRIEDATEIIKQGEELLKLLPNKLTTDYKKRKARLIWIMGASNNKIFNLNGDVNVALEHFYQSLALQEEVGDIEETALSIVSIIFNLGVIKGETDMSLKYIGRFLDLIEKKVLKNKHNIALGLSCVKQVYGLRGDFDLSIKYCEQSLEVFKELNNILEIAALYLTLGELHRMKGEIDRALEYGEQSLALFNEAEMLRYSINAHGLIIRILIDKGDVELAQQHLNDIELIKKHLKDKKVNFHYLYHKAIILKTSPRAKNRVEAEEILREIIVEENVNFLEAILELCDLLLVELSMTNDLEVLQEIESFITQLLDESERMNSYSFLAETYFLKAKLALLTFDLLKARRFLTQAQQIAKKYGMNQLAIKISNEHDELLKKLDMWENLKESTSTLKERMEFARLNEQMENLVRKRAVEVPELSDEEPILLIVVSEGGLPIFSQIFVKDQSFEDHIFGGFFTAINSFISEKFSEGLDRATFGEHTLLMNSVTPFFMCYVFKGQSYSAQQRIQYFIEKIQNDEEIWQIFKKFHKLNKEIQLKDIPSLEPLINEIFIDKIIPLN
jgi:tetratricopeptide (TPR) repeat protein